MMTSRKKMKRVASGFKPIIQYMLVPNKMQSMTIKGNSKKVFDKMYAIGE